MVAEASSDPRMEAAQGEASSKAVGPGVSEAAAGEPAPLAEGTVKLWQLPLILNVPLEEDIRFLMSRVAADRRRADALQPHDLANLISVGLFDVDWYAQSYGQDWGSSGDAAGHFRTIGCHGSFQPNYVFDNVWYRSMYPDVAEAGVAPLLHYFRGGEKEWRRPALWFDTAWYLSTYSSEIGGGGALVHYLRNRKTGRFSPNPLFDCKFYLQHNAEAVKAAGGDPFEHFLLRGYREGRNPSPTFDLKAYAKLKLSGRADVNALLHAIAGGVGYVMEAARAEEAEPVCGPPTPEGAAQGPAEAPKVYSPAPETLVLATPLAEGTDLCLAAPLARQRVRLAYEAVAQDDAKLAALLSKARGESRVAPAVDYPDDLKAAAAEFDPYFYLQAYDEVREQGLDPVTHYFETGWKAGYDPAPWFSTSYYMSSNPDIAHASINPFWHYIVAGRKEGRLPKIATGLRRRILADLRRPEERAALYCEPQHRKVRKGELSRTIAKALSGAAGAVLSISHDCYPLIVGGTQVFISDEQRKFNARKYCYLHLSPLRGGLTANAEPAETSIMRLVVDGEVIGAASGSDIADALEAASKSFEGRRIFVVHCALGHSVNALLAAHAAFRPAQAFYWLHDYSSICAGFNLLRNDIEYCGAPPPGSMACNICIYGESRAAHLSAVSRLFDACGFRVVSPSESAREIWSGRSTLRHEGLLTVGHSAIDATGIWRDMRPPEEIGQKENPVRIAFMGYKSVAKGWGAFERIVDETCGNQGYAFHHFGIQGEDGGTPRVKRIDVAVNAEDRDAMAQALMKENIDIVVHASLWPETFSYTLHEALAAGCDVMTLAESGNVARKVRETGRGLVFANEDELVDFFVSGRAIAWTAARAREGICRGALRQTGTTAALLVDDL